MPTLDELAENTSSELSSVLQSAIETISSNQSIIFRMYVKQVLPLDGFVFWVNAGILRRAELERLGIEPPFTATISGSLHRQVFTEQSETLSHNVNNIIFTPTSKIDGFNIESPEVLFLGEYDGTQFAFSRMESRYTQTGIYHYRGTAVLPTMRTQIIDSPDDITEDLIVSNSIPIWLSLKQFATVYPSFLSPANLRPPYIVVDIRDTVPIQAAPRLKDGIRWQLVKDRVRITMYGLGNSDALDYVNYVVMAALEEEQFGVTNAPVIVDGKSKQVEIGALAKVKHVDFDINYQQATTSKISKQIIKEAIMNYEVSNDL